MLCRSAFSLPFSHLTVARKINFPNKVPYNLHFLSAVATGLIRRMDYDFLYKLIHYRRGSFFHAHILANDGGKVVKVCLVLPKDMNSVLLCINKFRQFFLLGFILRRQFQKRFVADCSVYIIFRMFLTLLKFIEF